MSYCFRALCAISLGKKAAHAKELEPPLPANPQVLGVCWGTSCTHGPWAQGMQGPLTFPPPASINMSWKIRENLSSKILTTNEVFSGRSSTRTRQHPVSCTAPHPRALFVLASTRSRGSPWSQRWVGGWERSQQEASESPFGQDLTLSTWQRGILVYSTASPLSIHADPKGSPVWWWF